MRSGGRDPWPGAAGARVRAWQPPPRGRGGLVHWWPRALERRVDLRQFRAEIGLDLLGALQFASGAVHAAELMRSSWGVSLATVLLSGDRSIPDTRSVR